MNPQESVSVVITTYNRSDAFLAVMAGLVQQTDRNFEVIVADDGSREEHRRAILESSAARELRVVHVWHPDIGFTASQVRNLGVAAAKGQYIIFLDGDCVPEVDFIVRHKALAQAGFFVNGSRVLLSPDLTQRVLAGSESVCGRSSFFWIKQRLLGHASKLSHLLRLPDGVWRLARKFSWKGIRSCNMALWKADFERVDGFDESFVGWGHEDADFVLRLHHSGVVRKNGFCATEVFHLWHEEAKRNKASQNAKIVRERVTTGVTRSTFGYSQNRANDDVVLTRL
ncbi:glycosyltransferase family 2 protein [Rhodoferax sp.]|uniref:glycosyltransferase family 2 protein n=1 Tax=Rhodoferax sp. TaxID=50421 RepID=UPI0019EF97B1|nr:glycosyltransferase family 2 protein [Rhodoferax sp.]MBE0473023.1 glycosyltransferase family 2 protein [Rhodoferax sp.]